MSDLRDAVPVAEMTSESAADVARLPDVGESPVLVGLVSQGVAVGHSSEVAIGRWPLDARWTAVSAASRPVRRWSPSASLAVTHETPSRDE